MKTNQMPSKAIRILAGLFALVVVIGLTALGNAEEAQGMLGVVTGGKLHLRESPGKTAQVLATYPNGTHVQITGTDGDWYAVQVSDGREGYMEKAFIYLTSVGLVENGNSYVNLRTAPSRDAKVIGEYGSGTRLTMLSEDGNGWAYVDINGTQGYMAIEFIQPAPAGQAAAQPAAPVVAQEGQTDYVLPVNGENEVVQQVGQTESEVSYDGALRYTIYFPKLNIPAADAAIAAWIDQTIAGARAALVGEETGTSLEITVQYDAYLADAQYIGVLETGFMDSGMFAHPTDLIFTLNVDVATGALLTYRDIFSMDKVEDILALLRSKLAQMDNDPLTDVIMDESWLTHTVLTDQGVTVVLPRGDFLAAVYGTQAVSFDYQTLVEQGLLSIAVPQTGAPAQQPSPADSTQPQSGRVIDPSKPMIALTFDDGPGNYTTQIVDILRQYDVRATFFMVGNRVANYEDAVRAVVAQGSEIGTHTWAHKDLTGISPDAIESQLRRGMDIIEQATGQKVTTMRPPYGASNKDVRDVSRTLGLTIVTWNVDTEDWKTNNADATYNAIMRHVKDGSIILCHEIKSSTAQVMHRVIPDLIDKGYQLLTVSELLSFSQTHGEAGMVYNHLDTSHLEGR